MKRRDYILGISVISIALAHCDSPSGGPRDGGGEGGTSALHMANGTNVGPIDVDQNGSMDGTGYDTNGDGRADEVDLNGDGIIDGEDNDGDGTITVWAELAGGAQAPSAEEQATQIPETDPDFDRRLDPMHPPAGAAPDTGEVLIPSSMTVEGADMNFFRPLQQGRQNSCVGFTIAAMATRMRHQREGGSINDLWASPAFMYSRQLAARNIMCNQYTYIQDGLNTLVREGAASLADVPYQSARTPDRCEDNPSGTQQHVFRIGSWEQINRCNRTNLREAIAAGGVVPFIAPITNNFQSWTGDAAQGVFRGEDGCENSSHCGGHAMLLVGYDDARQAYRIQNSWGTDWGDRGYMWWDYADFERRVSYCAVATPWPGAPPAFAAPDPDHFSATVVGGVVLRAAAPVANYLLSFRAQFSEPVRLTGVTITDSANTERQVNFNQWIAYGNIAVRYDSAPAGGAATVRLSGVLRDNATATATVNVMIPAQEPDSDGQD